MKNLFSKKSLSVFAVSAVLLSSVAFAATSSLRQVWRVQEDIGVARVINAGASSSTAGLYQGYSNAEAPYAQCNVKSVVGGGNAWEYSDKVSASIRAEYGGFGFAMYYYVTCKNNSTKNLIVEPRLLTVLQ